MRDWVSLPSAARMRSTHATCARRRGEIAASWGSTTLPRGVEHGIHGADGPGPGRRRRGRRTGRGRWPGRARPGPRGGGRERAVSRRDYGPPRPAGGAMLTPGAARAAPRHERPAPAPRFAGQSRGSATIRTTVEPRLKAPSSAPRAMGIGGEGPRQRRRPSGVRHEVPEAQAHAADVGGADHHHGHEAEGRRVDQDRHALVDGEEPFDMADGEGVDGEEAAGPRSARTGSVRPPASARGGTCSGSGRGWAWGAGGRTPARPPPTPAARPGHTCAP